MKYPWYNNHEPDFYIVICPAAIHCNTSSGCKHYDFHFHRSHTDRCHELCIYAHKYDINRCIRKDEMSEEDIGLFVGRDGE